VTARDIESDIETWAREEADDIRTQVTDAIANGLVGAITQLPGTGAASI
jgi:hypothetical protein